MGSGKRDEERKKPEAENRSKGRIGEEEEGARDVLFFQLPPPCPLPSPTYFKDICSFFAFDVAALAVMSV